MMVGDVFLYGDLVWMVTEVESHDFCWARQLSNFMFEPGASRYFRRWDAGFEAASPLRLLAEQAE